ncbi:MAG: polymer-forming cytoskeletal protein [Eubacteriales bacterium]|nr:polymer-forming cytoskeletal protein [Eubacteriales bacterium]MDD3200244.1 polymer-forming cytoskeletal protein [Eubacteriales bacterium]MDD4630136.1 polymer-forming cytoskeletal protein [Eubacteriales bacterium]
MKDFDENMIKKNDEMDESFSDLLKKVVEKQLEEENPTAEEPEVVIKAEQASSVKKVETPVLDWGGEEPKAVNYEPVSEMGIISPSTSINGTVSSKGHIRIEGGIIGDVFAYGDIKVVGKVAGDIEGSSLDLDNCIVEGDIKARGDLNVGKESTLSGNISGQLITIEGKIKGDVEAARGAHMSGTSIVRGSISAPTLSMSAGAQMQGKVKVSKDNDSIE